MPVRSCLTVSVLALSFCLSACNNDRVREPAENLLSAEDSWLQDIELSEFMDCARESNATLIQAHRAGARPGLAENAISTMQAAMSDGAIFLEIDVARLSDGTLVLMHDDTVDRTTNGQGDVLSFNAESFSALQLVDEDGTLLEESPPTLRETFEVLDGRGISQLDLKDITVADIADAIVMAGATDRSIVITYTLDDAIALHNLLPDVMISAGIDSLSDIQTLRDAGFDLTRLQAWLGVGNGNPDLDAALADLGVETSFGNFGAEREGTASYIAMADAGAEVISVDNVPAASRALRAAQQVRGLLASCPAARVAD